MKVLVATAMYPTLENPAFGSFIKTQVESLERAGIEMELLVLSGLPRKLIYPKGVFQLRRRLADSTIDLVHAHFSYVGIVARTQWKLPLVVTYHGDDLLGTVVDDRGQHSRFSSMMVLAGRQLGRLADAAIVQTKEMAHVLGSRQNVYIVPHEVDFELFRPMDKDQARRAIGLDAEKKYLLFAADPRIPVKHFSLARAVADRLARRDPAVELIVASKEPQGRLASYMNACDALVFPSFQEGSPNVVKQAMACNMPIVATDVGDVREVIGGTAGCQICNPDVEDFSARLRQILYEGRRTEGREHVRHFDREVVAKQVIRVYEETLRRCQARN